MRISKIKPNTVYAEKGWPAIPRSIGWLLYVRKIENDMVDYCILKNYEWDNLNNPVEGYYRKYEIPLHEFANRVVSELSETMAFFWFVLQWFSDCQHTVDGPYVNFPEDDKEYIIEAFKTYSESVLTENGLRFTKGYKSHIDLIKRN